MTGVFFLATPGSQASAATGNANTTYTTYDGMLNLLNNTNNDSTLHSLPNGVEYAYNGTIVIIWDGKLAIFHADTNDTSRNAVPVPDPPSGCTPNSNSSSPYQYTVRRGQCGLLGLDLLNNETMTQQQLLANNKQFWFYFGDAPAEKAPYAINRDSKGLHIGVQAPASGTYAGFYAESPNANATLYNAVLTAPVRTIPSNSFQNGLYVQTSSKDVNYLTCTSITNNAGTIWVVEHTYGTTSGSNQFFPLYVDNSQNQPLTRDCTLVTNGNNFAKAYFDGKEVYSNSSLSLQMPMPFNAYLEPESSYNGQLMYGTYNNFYETKGDSINFTYAPQSAAKSVLVSNSSKTLNSTTVSGGTSTTRIGGYSEPINGSISLYDSNNRTVATMVGYANIFGGDVFYAVNSTAKPPSTPTNLAATDPSSPQINLSWVAPANSNGSPIIGYMIQKSADGGTNWSTLTSNTGSTATRYTDTSVAPGSTYYYKVYAENLAGTSPSSNMAAVVTSSGSVSSNAVATSVQSTQGSTSSSPYQLMLPNFNAGAGNFLVVGISARGSTANSVTFGGTPLTKAVSSFNNNDAELWYLKKANGTGNIVATMAGSTTAAIGAYSLQGVNQTDPIVTTAANHNTATAGSPTISIAAKHAGDWVIDLPSIYGGQQLGLPTCAKQWDVNVPSQITGASSSTIVQSPSTIICGWTASNGGDLWDDVAFEVRAASISPIPPSAPTGLAATGGNTQVLLSWTAPSSNGGSPITNYKIYRSTTTNTETLVATAGNVTSYTDTGLTNGQQYFYEVTAVNAAGESAQSGEAGATPVTVSASPTTLSVMAVSSSQVNLSWTAPSSNGGSPITGYEIERAKGDLTFGSFNNSTNTLFFTYANKTSFNDTGLVPSTTYNYTVFAKNSAGPSSHSNVVSATTLTVPSDPQNLLARSGNAQVLLSWSAPSSNGGSAVIGYNLYRSTTSGSELLFTNIGNATSYTDTSVTNGHVYFYKVTSVNSIGESQKSNEASATPAATPSAPAELAATTLSSSQINLSWTPPSSNGGSPITGYEIERARGDLSFGAFSNSSETLFFSYANVTSFSDTGLMPGTAYNYTVFAKNSAGPSPHSNTVSATTLTVPAAPQNLQAAPASSSQINLSWTAPSNNGGSAVTSYNIYRGTTSGGEAKMTSVSASSTSYNDTGLASGQKYYYEVTAVNAAGESAKSSEASATLQPTVTVPSAPTGLTATGDNETVSLSWAAPSSNGGSPVTGYNIYRGTASGGESSSPLVTGITSTTFLDRGLTNGVTYYYVVKAVNSAGPSHASGEASATPATVPSAPTGLVAAAGNAHVMLSWTVPASNGGSQITGYNVYRSTTPGGEGTAPPIGLDVASPSYDDTGLTDGTTYYYKITAVNSVGESVQSSEASATPQPAVPSAPQNLQAASASSSQVNLSWIPPTSNGGSPITGYEIERAKGDLSFGSFFNTTSTFFFSYANKTSFNDTGLAPSTAYNYTVFAKNSAGSSAHSNTVVATTGTAPPPPSGILLNNVQSTSGTTSSSNQVTLSSFNTGSGTNKILAVGVSANNQFVTSVTFNGAQLTKAVTSFNNNDAEFWYLKNPSGTGNIVVTFAGQTQAVVGAYSLANVNQSSPIANTAASHNTASSSPSISIATKYANDWVLDLPSIYGGQKLGLPTCTQGWDANIPSAITGASSSKAMPSPGSVTCGWTASNGGDLWDDVAIELKAAG